MFLRCLVVTLVFVVVAAKAAQPFDAKATFYSDDVLQRALANIGQMQEPELRAFTRYLSECDDNELVDVPTRHACHAAQITYTVEFGAKRALDDIIIARALLNILTIVHAKPEPDMELSIAKHTKVMSALEHAAGDRFRALRSNPQH
jgi:hypothetical protein